MKQKFLMFATVAFMGLGIYSCQKEAGPVEENSAIPESVLTAIGKAGFLYRERCSRWVRVCSGRGYLYR